jgi:hypothetical protein
MREDDRSLYQDCVSTNSEFACFISYLGSKRRLGPSGAVPRQLKGQHQNRFHAQKNLSVEARSVAEPAPMTKLMQIKDIALCLLYVNN